MQSWQFGAKLVSFVGAVSHFRVARGYVISTDGNGASVAIPRAILVDSAGNVYVASQNKSTVVKLSSTGVVTSGCERAALGSERFSFDAAGNRYIADYGNARIREAMPAGTISTIAGNGASAYGGAGGPAGSARLGPYGLAFDVSGNLFVADRNNNRIRKTTAAGMISNAAGNRGLSGFAGDEGLATSAKIYAPTGAWLLTAPAICILG